MMVTFDQDGLRSEIAAIAQDFLASRSGPDRLRVRQHAEPDDWSAIADLGWLDLLRSEKLGGLGLGALEAGVVLEAAGRHLHVGPLLETMVGRAVMGDAVELAPDAVVSLAVGGQSARWEDWPGSHPPVEDGTLSGRVPLVPFADVADVLIVAVYDAGELALVAVRTSQKAVAARAQLSADLCSRPCEVTFDRARPMATLARGARAEAALTSLRAYGFALTATRTTAVMQYVLDLAVGHARDREQFGRPIGGFQAVQHRLADMFATTTAAQSACVAALASLVNDKGDAYHRASVAKAFSARAVRTTGEASLQILGGIGFTDEHVFHLYFKHGLALAAAWGDAATHEGILATSLLKRASAGEVSGNGRDERRG